MTSLESSIHNIKELKIKVVIVYLHLYIKCSCHVHVMVIKRMFDQNMNLFVVVHNVFPVTLC